MKLLPLATLLSASLLLGCSEDTESSSNEPDAGSLPSPDAMSQEPVADAQVDAAPALDLAGAWTDWVQTGPTYDSYRMQLKTDGELIVDRRRADGYGEFINCVLIERWTGTWSIEGDTIHLVPAAGTTRRIDEIGGLSCDSDALYPERPMTSEEIGNHNYLGGSFVMEDNRLSITTSAWTWTWDRE